MSAAFVGGPIRALAQFFVCAQTLSSGVRLHSLLCVLVKILQLAYKTTSRSAKLSDLHRPYLVARATYGLTSAWRASLQARPAPCALSTRVGAQLRRQSQHSEISPTALAGARGSQAHKGDLKRQDAVRPANPADGQVLRLRPPGVKQHARTSGGRLTKASDGKIEQTEGVHIGGAFTPEPKPAFTAHRESVWDAAAARRAAQPAPEKKPITITLPDGNTKEGVAFETSPLTIALGISKQLAGRMCCARVTYASNVQITSVAINQFDEDDDVQSDVDKALLWDLARPLEGDCTLELLGFDSPEGKMVFWHSAAHLLGAALEQKYGAKLSIGPPVEGGFYYDAYMGTSSVSDKEFKELQQMVTKMCNAKHKFERLALTKEELLEMFAYNPFQDGYHTKQGTGR